MLQLPVLIFLGLPFSVALATHKIASVALGIGASIKHVNAGNLELWLVAIILLSGLPGVVLGAMVILHTPERWSEVALGFLTISLGIYSWRKRDLGLSRSDFVPNRNNLFIGCSTLFLIGVLNGSLTSGTGLFVTLWLVRWFGLDYTRAVAYTLVLVGMFWNGSGAVTLGMLGTVEWDWLPALLLGSIVGGYLGAHMAIRYGSKSIKRAFELVTIVVGLSLLLK